MTNEFGQLMDGAGELVGKRWLSDIFLSELCGASWISIGSDFLARLPISQHSNNLSHECLFYCNSCLSYSSSRTFVMMGSDQILT